MEMRKCKECGKLFMPKGREQYCSDVHYRPCPICGEPVIAKYLSDPPRKCEKCKHTKTQPQKFKNKSLFGSWANIDPNKSKSTTIEVDSSSKPGSNNPEIVIDTKDLITDIPATIGQAEFCEQITGAVRRYIGVPIKGSFIPNHDYLMKVEHDEYTYGVTVLEDLTEGEDVNIFRNFSSQISIHQNFARKKEAS